MRTLDSLARVQASAAARPASRRPPGRRRRQQALLLRPELRARARRSRPARRAPGTAWQRGQRGARLPRRLLQAVAAGHQQPRHLRESAPLRGRPAIEKAWPGRRAQRAPPQGRAGAARPRTRRARCAVSRPACAAAGVSGGAPGAARAGPRAAGRAPGLAPLVVPGVQQRVAQDVAIPALRAAQPALSTAGRASRAAGRAGGGAHSDSASRRVVSSAWAPGCGAACAARPRL
jgi:hypothetical protein